MSHRKHPMKSHESPSSIPVPNPAGGERQSDLGTPSTDLIRRRAYEISLARNGGPGDALADWIQAEQEAGAAHQGRSR